jgi:hypothetical protein
MNRPDKVKALVRVPPRKTALTASPASRRAFPAWIAADEGDVAFPARTAAAPRVQDGLVLRTVSKYKSPGAGGSRHGDSTR